MENLLQKIKESASFIIERTNFKPTAGIILGSGLAELVKQIQVHDAIAYKDIPNFPVSTVSGHPGKLVLGTLNGKKVAVLQGRFHYYEGYTMQEVSFPVRVMKYIGVETLLLTNASGGLNPAIKVGELMVITDHINLQIDNPLIGKNEEELGPRFPDQHAVYDKELIQQALDIAAANKIICHKGVYVSTPGPTFETPAEYRFMRIIGGDAVGMSTVPEAITARHMNMRVFGMSVITDEGNPESPVKVTHEEVIRAANEAEPRMSLILKELIGKI